MRREPRDEWMGSESEQLSLFQTPAKRKNREEPAGGSEEENPTPFPRDEAPADTLFHDIEDLATLADIAAGCQRCGLRAGCRGVVFGEGPSRTDLMLVGEGPGATEDEWGRPFVGKAGQLLDRILAAVGFTREDVYITNIVKCRPPGNRQPTEAEIRTCLPYLYAQIRLLRPRILVCLGSTAVRGLIDPEARITRIRGQWRERWGIAIMPTFHPAALLRDPSKKRPVWEDFKAIRRRYDALRSG